MEEWKDIEGYEGYYQVSNIGNVRSLDRITYNKNIKYFYKGKNLSKGLRRYYEVNLFKNGKGQMFRVHRLVAKTFIPNPENKLCVNHIDGNKLNNCIDNLEWCTYKENNKHAVETGLNNSKTIKLNYKGVEKNLIEWSKETGIKRATLYFRYKNKWEIKDILNVKVKIGRNQYEKRT